MRKRDIFTVFEGKGEGRLRIYCQTSALFIREDSQTLVYTLWQAVIPNLEGRPGIVSDAVFIIQDPPGIWTPKVT